MVCQRNDILAPNIQGRWLQAFLLKPVVWVAVRVLLWLPKSVVFGPVNKIMTINNHLAPCYRASTTLGASELSVFAAIAMIRLWFGEDDWANIFSVPRNIWTSSFAWRLWRFPFARHVFIGICKTFVMAVITQVHYCDHKAVKDWNDKFLISYETESWFTSLSVQWRHANPSSLIRK